MRTKSNKAELLAVLEEPALPLHNNAAELAVRQIVRKRDVSLHTWSEKGTRVRDAFLTIVETAKKLGVSTIEYISTEFPENMRYPLWQVLWLELMLVDHVFLNGYFSLFYCASKSESTC